MQLTRHTDSALRMLIHLAFAEGELVSIAAVADSQRLSKSHYMKIASELVHGGFVEAMRGRTGGLRLARPPQEIRLSDVIRVVEGECDLVDCARCRVQRCALPQVFGHAVDAFFAVLADHTLADIMAGTAGGGTILPEALGASASSRRNRDLRPLSSSGSCERTLHEAV